MIQYFTSKTFQGFANLFTDAKAKGQQITIYGQTYFIESYALPIESNVLVFNKNPPVFNVLKESLKPIPVITNLYNIYFFEPEIEAFDNYGNMLTSNRQQIDELITNGLISVTSTGQLLRIYQYAAQYVPSYALGFTFIVGEAKDYSEVSTFKMFVDNGAYQYVPQKVLTPERIMSAVSKYPNRRGTFLDFFNDIVKPNVQLRALTHTPYQSSHRQKTYAFYP
jgi:hypothetical protein